LAYCGALAANTDLALLAATAVEDLALFGGGRRIILDVSARVVLFGITPITEDITATVKLPLKNFGSWWAWLACQQFSRVAPGQ